MGNKILTDKHQAVNL